ncbi:threonine--tRNA ligase [Candidatus Kaiserbacteria bacterium]|nr:threonine--tRNA ligase [Candidatus Kaiserbacteria bacterium]
MERMSDENLSNIRHSLAHVLATAVLKYDHEVKIAIGPSTDTGFYYDFEFSEGKTVGEDNLKKLEKEMRNVLKRGFEPEHKEISVDEAKTIFKDQPYKLELIEEIATSGNQITTYTIGDFTDLCEGPHVTNSKEIKPDSFSLSHVAGAYWRGDEKNTMLTRIYGVAFETKEELEKYIELQEEAKKRDHRKLGKELGLFTFSDLVGPGLPLFTPKGTAMRRAIVDKISNIQKEYGYEEVTIPHIAKQDLYETSGHWEKFGDELFKVTGAHDSTFIMKPMNCPHHTQIYAGYPRSYKDLPIRFTETTMVYRDEQAGELLGLSRVRSISQDDGHVFCTPEQIIEESTNIADIIKQFYTSLGMWGVEGSWVSLSVRDPETPEEYIGDEPQWRLAEDSLESVAKSEGLTYKRVEGEAAFYGPKLDFMFKDALGRERQLATIQLDLMMPVRFGLEYTDSNGDKQTPVMIHRAIAGSLERFMSVIIEHFAGNFPLWLSPVQVSILPIGDSHFKYAKKIAGILKAQNIRVELDTSAETLGKKIRNVKLSKTPYFLVIGDEEVTKGEVTLESRDEGKIGSLTTEALTEKLLKEIAGNI